MSTPTSQRRPDRQGPQSPQNSKQRYVPSGPVMVPLESPRKRIRFVTFIFLVVMSLYMARLVEIQVVRGPELAANAQNSRLQTLTLPALRGNFTDSEGVPIATTVIARNVTVDPKLITDPAGTAAALSPILGIPVKTIVAALTVDSRF